MDNLEYRKTSNKSKTETKIDNISNKQNLSNTEKFSYPDKQYDNFEDGKWLTGC